MFLLDVWRRGFVSLIEICCRVFRIEPAQGRVGECADELNANTGNRICQK